MLTTKKDFKLFCNECLKWQKILGLYDYEFTFNHLKDNNNSSYYASCIVNATGRAVMFNLYETWPSVTVKKTNSQIKLSAFHEVCHVLVDYVGSCGRARYVSEHEIIEGEHAVIRILEKVLFTKY